MSIINQGDKNHEFEKLGEPIKPKNNKQLRLKYLKF